MLAGLVHDIGAFYMLYRASQYEDLRLRPDTLNYLIVRWHESIGESILSGMGMPEEIIDAIRDHDQPRPITHPVRKFDDVIHVSNVLAGGLLEWRYRDEGMEDVDVQAVAEPYLALRDEVDACVEDMLAVFG